MAGVEGGEGTSAEIVAVLTRNSVNREAVRQALIDALAWGATYGKIIPPHQWDDMRDTQVRQHMERIFRS